jgi:hypothetical protein
MQNVYNLLIRDLGGVDWWKNEGQKSRNTDPLNYIIIRKPYQYTIPELLYVQIKKLTWKWGNMYAIPGTTNIV